MSTPLGPISVLYVDDDVDFAATAAELLEREDDTIDVSIETSADDALDRIAAGEIDCIVSDYDGPETNGVEFLETVRAKRPAVPFILFTGTGDEKVASDAISAGVTDYLRREEGTDQYAVLADRIRSAVDAARTRRDRQRKLDAIETAREGISILDDDGYFVYVNEAYADTYGYEPAELVGEHWELLYRDDDVSHIREEALPSVEETGHWHGTTTGLRADGSTFTEDHVLSTTDHGDLVCTVRDVTGRHEHSDELESERAFIEQALETLDDIFYVVGMDGTLQRWNDRLASVTGYTDAEIADMHATEFFPEDERERISAAITETLRTGQATTETALLTANDDRVPYEFTGAPLTDHEGETIGVVGIGRDISERQERKRELEREHDRSRAIFEEAFDAMVIADDNGQYIDVNESATEMFGLSRDELLGRSISEFAPDDFDFETAWREFRTSERERSTFPLVRPDGTELTVEYAATSDIVPGQHLSVLRDVTEREERESELKQTAARLGALYEQSPVMINIHDADGNIIDPNPRLCEKTGYDEGELAAMKVWDLDQTIDPTGAANLWEEMEHGDRRSTDGTYRRKGGSTFPVEIHVRCLDLEGEDRFMVISRDITERAERERELEQRNERLDEFASVVSHDLRNPLNVAQGRVELAQDESESDHLDAVAQAQDRMESLIDDLLALARTDGETIDVEAFDLGILSEQCWRNVETGDARLVTETDLTVFADRSQLQQLLENLMRNAVEHGGPTVTVSVGALDGGFYVADDGSGLPGNDFESLFETGYSTTSGGSGLGLSIVAQVVDAHGWEIDVTEGDDGGARFEITGVERGS